jgi:hypothetical protein
LSEVLTAEWKWSDEHGLLIDRPAFDATELGELRFEDVEEGEA